VEQAVFLVVDDDPSIARDLSRVLSAFGAVRTAGSVAAAFEALEVPTAWSGFVIDLRLPDGSGLDVLARVRERHPLTFAALLSGYRDPEVINATFALSATYLCKPCRPEYLRQFAQEALLSDREIPKRISKAVGAMATAHALSPAQAEILLAAVCGVDRPSIVSSRRVSENTHKSQVRGMLRKTQTLSLGELRDRVLRSVGGTVSI
jgi:DNA-binding NarL/FixJ family response regulator